MEAAWIAARHWDVKLGVLAEGAAADIGLMDYHPPTTIDEAEAAAKSPELSKKLWQRF